MTPDNGRVVLKENIDILRKDIADLAELVNSHIGAGGYAHEEANYNQTGFMTAAQYKRLLAFQNAINALSSRINKGGLPTNAILYWARPDDEIPTGYVACDGSNGTPDLRGVFILGADSDNNIGTVMYSHYWSTANVPLPRHNHYFRNYCASENWGEINDRYGGDGRIGLEQIGNMVGSGDDDSATVYPLYLRWGTDAACNNGAVTVDIRPPFKVIRTIMRNSTSLLTTALKSTRLMAARRTVPVHTGPVGALYLLIGSNAPAGTLLLQGDWVKTSMYPDLTSYVRNAGLLVSNAEYELALTEHGMVSSFTMSEDETLLRLPYIPEVTLVIRAFHAVPDTIEDSELYDLYGDIDTLNKTTIMAAESAQTQLEENESLATDADSLVTDNGFLAERDGLTELWGTMKVNAGEAHIVFPRKIEEVYYVSADAPDADIIIKSFTGSGVTVYASDDAVVAYRAFGK